MLILHGDNLIKSRQALKEQIDQARAEKKQIERVEAKQLTQAELEELLGSMDLFGSEKLIIIEGLHSLSRSKNKKALIKQIAATNNPNLVLWEKRALTKTMLKKFPEAKVKGFKSSSSLFKWLDLLGNKNQSKKLKLLHQAIESDGDYFCFLMLIRQIRMMIQAKDGGKIAGPPFVVKKIKRQAGKFSLGQLLKTHQRLYKLDRRQKTSNSPLSLARELDLMTLSL